MDIGRADQVPTTAKRRDAVERRSILARWALPMSGSRLSLAVAVLVACLYAATLAQDFSGDDLQYAMVIEQFVTETPLYHPSGSRPYRPETADRPPVAVPSSTLLNPRYLLEYPTSALMAKAWRLLGWRGGTIAPILALRLLAGACGIMFFSLAISHVTTRRASALVAAVGLATSSAYWMYSTHPDQSMFMVALVCLALLLLVRFLSADLEPRRVWPLSVTLAIATFYNFTAVLTAGLFGLAIVFAVRSVPLARRLRWLIGFATLYALVVAGGLVAAIAIWRGPGSLIQGDFWRGVMFLSHPEYGVGLERDIVRAVLGFAKSQAVYPRASAGSLQHFWDGAGTTARLGLLAFYGIVLALMAVPLVPSIRRPEGRLPFVLAAWIGLYAAFNLWWDPGYMKYWLIPLVGWWGLIALGLDRLALADSGIRRRAPLIAGTCVALVFASNLVAVSLSGRIDQRWSDAARVLRQSEANALFISTSPHPLDFNIAYFSQRDVVSPPLIRYGTGGDERRVEELLAEHVAQHQAVGGPIYIYGLEALAPAQREAILSLLPAGQLRVAWRFADMVIYLLVP